MFDHRGKLPRELQAPYFNKGCVDLSKLLIFNIRDSLIK